MNDKTSIQPGRYRHYKGNEYTVIGTACHSETLVRGLVRSSALLQVELLYTPRGKK